MSEPDIAPAKTVNSFAYLFNSTGPGVSMYQENAQKRGERVYGGASRVRVRPWDSINTWHGASYIFGRHPGGRESPIGRFEGIPDAPTAGANREEGLQRQEEGPWGEPGIRSVHNSRPATGEGADTPTQPAQETSAVRTTAPSWSESGICLLSPHAAS